MKAETFYLLAAIAFAFFICWRMLGFWLTVIDTYKRKKRNAEIKQAWKNADAELARRTEERKKL